MNVGPLLEIEDLARHYPNRARGTTKAVDGISFRLFRGETLALVGESGCGKSTTARLVLRLIEPTHGIIRFEGADITDLRGQPMRRLRRRMQMVFQDPFASLNPRMTIGEILEEPLRVHDLGGTMQRRARVNQLLAMVGLDAFHATRYPHAFSGGQRQRIGLARALAAEPALVVCDEPVSALDVSIQAQIVNLMKDLQASLQLSYLFIAHDLAVVKHMADRVAVMYLGRIVETAPTATLFADPRHPYTRALLAAIPRPESHRRNAPVPASGETPMDVTQGLPFRTALSLRDRCVRPRRSASGGDRWGKPSVGVPPCGGIAAGRSDRDGDTGAGGCCAAGVVCGAARWCCAVGMAVVNAAMLDSSNMP